MSKKPFLTEDDLATRWHVSKRTLQAWRAQGHRPRYVKLGTKCVRYPLDEVEDVEQEQLRTSTSEDAA